MGFWDFDPFDELRRIGEELSRVFRNIGVPVVAEKSLTPYRCPVVDIYETENNIVARFELPGVDKKDIDLNVTEDYIEVSVKRKLEKEVKKEGYFRYESRSQQFYRRVPLPVSVQPEKAEAIYKNGILTVQIPKTKVRTKKKKIQIK